MLLAGSEVLPSLSNLFPRAAAGTPPWPPVVLLTDAALAATTVGGRDVILPRPRLGGMGGGAGSEEQSFRLSLSSLSPVLVET